MIYQIKPVIGNSAKKNIIKYIKGNNWLTEYKKTAEFEKKFAKFTNSKYCIAFPNGTLTMYAILESLNLKKNSEVLVSNYTMVATANIVKMSGLKLKLVGSIVAISGINLLEAFMDIGNLDDRNIKWQIYIHLVFVVSGVLLALMDFIASKTKNKY